MARVLGWGRWWWWWGYVPAVEASGLRRWVLLVLLLLLLLLWVVLWWGRRRYWPVGLERRLWRWRLVELLWDRRHEAVVGTPAARHGAVVGGSRHGWWW